MRRRLFAYLPLLLGLAALPAGVGPARADVLSPAAAPSAVPGRVGGLSGFDGWLPYAAEFVEVADYLRVRRGEAVQGPASGHPMASDLTLPRLPRGPLEDKEPPGEFAAAPPGMSGDAPERGKGRQQDGSLPRQPPRPENDAAPYVLEREEARPSTQGSRLFRPPRGPARVLASLRFS